MLNKVRWHAVKSAARAAALDEANKNATGYGCAEPAMDALEMVVRDLYTRVEKLEARLAAGTKAPVTTPAAGTIGKPGAAA